MTDRIDHAEEARWVLRRMARLDYPDVAQAQVHATLALVEQQRIANLIAVRLHPEVLEDNEVAEGLGYMRVSGAPE